MINDRRKELQLQINLLVHTKAKYIQTVKNMRNYFEMTDADVRDVKDKAEKVIEGYDKDINTLKDELNKLHAEASVQSLKKELLETGKLDQQKIEDTVKELGIESIELSPEAQEMKKHQSKVNNIFSKHLNKSKDNDNQ